MPEAKCSTYVFDLDIQIKMSIHVPIAKDKITKKTGNKYTLYFIKTPYVYHKVRHWYYISQVKLYAMKTCKIQLFNSLQLVNLSQIDPRLTEED